jgi:hypothetical protein
MSTPEENLAIDVRAHQYSKGKTNRFDNNTLPLHCIPMAFIRIAHVLVYPKDAFGVYFDSSGL